MAFLSPGSSGDTCSREIHSYQPQIPLLISTPTLPSFSAVPAGDGDGCWAEENQLQQKGLRSDSEKHIPAGRPDQGHGLPDTDLK